MVDKIAAARIPKPCIANTAPIIAPRRFLFANSELMTEKEMKVRVIIIIMQFPYFSKTTPF